jgi:chromosome segregation ATPase
MKPIVHIRLLEQVGEYEQALRAAMQHITDLKKQTQGHSKAATKAAEERREAVAAAEARLAEVERDYRNLDRECERLRRENAELRSR